MLSQNFQVSSDYACDMLIFVCFPKFFIFIIQRKSECSLICLSYAYYLSTSEPEYAYKRYAYKKNMCYEFGTLSSANNNNKHLFFSQEIRTRRFRRFPKTFHQYVLPSS